MIHKLHNGHNWKIVQIISTPRVFLLFWATEPSSLLEGLTPLKLQVPNSGNMSDKKTRTERILSGFELVISKQKKISWA